MTVYYKSISSLSLTPHYFLHFALAWSHLLSPRIVREVIGRTIGNLWSRRLERMRVNGWMRKWVKWRKKNGGKEEKLFVIFIHKSHKDKISFREGWSSSLGSGLLGGSLGSGFLGRSLGSLLGGSLSWGGGGGSLGLSGGGSLGNSLGSLLSSLLGDSLGGTSLLGGSLSDFLSSCGSCSGYNQW